MGLIHINNLWLTRRICVRLRVKDGMLKSLEILAKIFTVLLLCSLAEGLSPQEPSTIIVGAVPTTSDAVFLANWSPTFEKYLNENVGTKFSPPKKFSLVTLSLNTVFDAVQSGKVDFVFANPTVYSCLEAEFSVSAVATLRNKVANGESSYFGGVFIARSDNHQINTISDLKGKIVEASSILLTGAGQAQWLEMRRQHLDLLVDPAQVIFVGTDQSKIVRDVYRGQADVGLVRTGYIEQMESLNLTKRGFFKYVNSKSLLLADGSSFPAELGTELYPEWPLAATSKVNTDLYLKVAAALMGIESSNEAAVKAGYSSWVPPLSYSALTLLNFELGVYKSERQKCYLSDDTVQAVNCPAGFYKRPDDEIAQRCSQLNLTCPAGCSCLCSPCKQADEVEVFMPKNKGALLRNNSRLCSKMGVCGSVHQNQVLQILVVTNGDEHSNDNISFRLRTSLEITGRAEYVALDDSYLIKVSTSERGNHVLEIFINSSQVKCHERHVVKCFILTKIEVQLPNSPFLINVGPAECGPGRAPADNGDCLCGHASFFDCEPLWQFWVEICICVLVVFGIAWYLGFHQGDRLTREERIMQFKGLELRSKLGITVNDGFILSSERAPIWRRQKTVAVVQMVHFEAAVRLALYREDFDVKHLDGFCMFLHDSPSNRNLCDWLLQISRYLLDPGDLSHHSRNQRARSLSLNSVTRAFANKVDDLSSVEFISGLKESTQEKRFDYFRSRVGRLRILREDNNWLFNQLKTISDEYTDSIRVSCVGRFNEMALEPKGTELLYCHSGSKLQCNDVQTLSDDHDMAFIPRPNMEAYLRDTFFQDELPLRQDHPMVEAIRVGEMDKQEAALQTQMLKPRVSHNSGRARLSSFTGGLDEEVFLAQLSLRSKLLNAEFQNAVLRLVESHGRAPHGSKPKEELPSTGHFEIECCFEEGPCHVEVHSSSPKTITRMREKLLKGASQILQVLGWFKEHEQQAGDLKICRVKNKFSFPAEAVPDGYRDLQVCVLFVGSNGLRIIGEIQIHDMHLHELKKKMHKLYEIKRAKNPDSFCGGIS